MRKNLPLFTLLILVFFCSVGLSQDYNLGIPFIKSFERDEYQAAAPNWSIVQDQQGLVYFANSEGLLVYDGRSWELFPLPNKSVLRALAISESGRIYAGGQNEIGYFSPDSSGQWRYHSLKRLIPESHTDFEDVWEIVTTDAGVFFRSSNKIFFLDSETSQVFSDRTYTFLGSANGKVIAAAQDGSISEIDQKESRSLGQIVKSEAFLIKGICALGDEIILATDQEGLYSLLEGKLEKKKLQNEALLADLQISSIQALKEGNLAIGTAFGGLLMLDAEGKIYQWIKQEDGLLRNSILGIYLDKSMNLWLGLDNGINLVQVNSPFRKIYPDESLRGTAYDIQIKNDEIFFATSNGLYRAPWIEYYPPGLNPNFQLIENSKGLTWGLDLLDNKLLLSDNRGASLVSSGRANRFFEGTGYWKFEALQKYPDISVAGNYQGVAFFRNKGEELEYLYHLEDFSESSRFLEQDNKGNVWIAHPYRGIFRIELSEPLQSSSVHQYGEKDGLTSDLDNHLFRIGDEIVFCSSKGSFLFDYQKERFIPFERFNNIFGDSVKIRRLRMLPNGDIWYISQNDFGVLKITDRGVEKEVIKEEFPQIEPLLNKGFEQIYGHNDRHVFITSEEGFILYDYKNSQRFPPFFTALVREVKITGEQDRILYGGASIGAFEEDSDGKIELSSDQNALKFSFSSTDYVSPLEVEYRFKLEGFDQDWSPWKQENTKEYTNLPPSSYTFVLEARKPNGELSEAVSYSFKIHPPWYASRLAYLIYALLLFAAIYFYLRQQNKKYQSLQEDHEQEIEASKKTIGKLREEQIQKELEFKKRELVSTTMHVLQKNELLERIKNDLQDIRRKSKDIPINKDLKKLIQMLQQDSILDKGWEQFLLHFNEVNKDFFQEIKTTYPDLTPKDLKLCAYMRMNLSTKEMASLLNVTVRGIEASRYRLRKKFELDSNQNLTEFLMAY
ncbi:MAG: triple tyrosine motif-containing protein [Bacteroidia bacterium]|nr:triple tyrosine motif-containing protein [Bacteroidia bacterium]